MDTFIASSDLKDIYDRVVAGKRLTYEDGLRLYRTPELLALGALADLVRQRIHGARTTGRTRHSIDVSDSPPIDDVVARVKAEPAGSVSEIHITGSINPGRKDAYYTKLLSAVKIAAPQVPLRAFTATALFQLAAASGRSPEVFLKELRFLGVACTGALVGEPLDMLRLVQRAGLATEATAPAVVGDDPAERLHYLIHLRDVQAETLLVEAFTPQGGALPNARAMPPSSGVADLRLIAVARLLLDNVEKVRAPCEALTPRVAQIALSFGADELEAGVGASVTRDELSRLIREAGKIEIDAPR